MYAPITILKLCLYSQISITAITHLTIFPNNHSSLALKYNQTSKPKYFWFLSYGYHYIY